jgi:hypothetical protein
MLTLTILTSLGLRRAKPSSVQGYTTRRHLLLDFDHRSREQVFGLTRLIHESYPELGGYIILKSSEPKRPGNVWLNYRQGCFAFRKKGRYHIVFDNDVGYEKCCTIIETLVTLDILDRRYGDIRKFRGDMTLRVSGRVESWGVIPKPQIVAGFMDITKWGGFSGIEEYLRMYRAVNLSGFSRLLCQLRLLREHTVSTVFEYLRTLFFWIPQSRYFFHYFRFLDYFVRPHVDNHS